MSLSLFSKKCFRLKQDQYSTKYSGSFNQQRQLKELSFDSRNSPDFETPNFDLILGNKHSFSGRKISKQTSIRVVIIRIKAER